MTTTTEYKDIPIFVPEITEGYVIKVHDGDTITIITSQKNSTKLYRFNIRISGIDAPELTRSSNIEKEYAKKSKNILENLILHKNVILENVCNDKYGGRYVSDVYIKNDNNEIISISSYMLENKLAVSYDGKKKLEFNEENFK